MNRFAASLCLALPLFAGSALQAQDLSPRMSLTAFMTQPADTAAKLYGSGWKVGLSVHVRREHEVEGRVRFEFGNFREGKELEKSSYILARYSAQTRLVGYDWLIPIGAKRESGVDFILGIGGAHWFRERQETRVPGTPYAYTTHSDTDHELGFAGTIGFRFRISRNVALELHHVLTSLPGSGRDFEDAELSHSAFGVGVRF